MSELLLKELFPKDPEINKGKCARKIEEEEKINEELEDIKRWM